jgi:hypothetical protein
MNILLTPRNLLVGMVFIGLAGSAGCLVASESGRPK